MKCTIKQGSATLIVRFHPDHRIEIVSVSGGTVKIPKVASAFAATLEALRVILAVGAWKSIEAEAE